jgi:glycosyltransferase involved in cell wall biosynthesis
MPLISVVMPAFNSERWIGEALTSVLSQAHGTPERPDAFDIEVLVIDDGSADRTAAVAAAFGEPVRVVTVRNGGPARARNTGIALARGDFIAFLDADDVWLPGKLAAQFARFERDPALGVCYTVWHVWPADERGVWSRPAWSDRPLDPERDDPQRSGWLYTRLLFDCLLLTTTVMVRADTLRRVGPFDEDLPVGEDYDLWLRLARQAPMLKLADVGALYRAVPGSASRQPRARNHELEVIERHLAQHGPTDADGRQADIGALRRRLWQLNFQHGWLHLRSGSPQVAREAFLRCLRLRPADFRPWWHWLRACWACAFASPR